MNTTYPRSLVFSKTERWLLASSLIFLMINLLLIFFFELYYLSLLPVILGVFYLYFFSVEKIFLIIAFFSPLAINLSDWDTRLSVNLPTEPLLAGLLLVFLLKSLYELNRWKAFSNNPISIAFYIYFIWLFFSSVTSQIPVVSWKFFVSHLWLMVPIYFIGTRIFYIKENTQKTVVLLQIVALTIVAVYTLIRHSGYNFGDREGHWVMQPFYKDHAIYGSAIALFIPSIFFFLTDKKYNYTRKLFLFLAFIILLLGLLFSYSRAAWLGFFIAVGIGLIVLLRIKMKILTIVFLSFLLIGLMFKSQIISRLEKNTQDSSKDVVENIQSMSNISTDASNLERLNRWNCALRMAKDYPICGTGPGTYQFLYAPYQFSYEKTRISTNAGTLGNAHAEFLGAMAESGIPGMLSVVFLVFSIFWYGFITYSRLRKTDQSKARFVLGLLLGLVTYFVHAFLNNFLDSDKIAVPVWSFVAIIVANGLACEQQENKLKEKIC